VAVEAVRRMFDGRMAQMAAALGVETSETIAQRARSIMAGATKPAAPPATTEVQETATEDDVDENESLADGPGEE
jgi:hypothetical protein